jgi:hypothetical protein
MCGCKVQFCLPKVQFNQTTGVYSFSTKGSVYYIKVYIILGSSLFYHPKRSFFGLTKFYIFCRKNSVKSRKQKFTKENSKSSLCEALKPTLKKKNGKPEELNNSGVKTLQFYSTIMVSR